MRRQWIGVRNLKHWVSAVILHIHLLVFFEQHLAIAQDFWQPNNGLSEEVFFSLLTTSNEWIFVGTDRGLFRSYDYGKAWKRIGSELKDSQIRDLAFDVNGDILAATFDKGVFLSTDDGENWTALNNGLTDLAVRSLAVSPNRSWFVSTGISGVFRSINQGQSWTEANNGLDDLRVFTLAINQNGEIFAGTSTKGIYRSADNGGTWTAVNNGLKDLLESTSKSTNELAITGQGYLFAATSVAVYRSKDNGQSWQFVKPGSPYYAVTVLQDRSSLLIGNGAIYLSTDNGDTWREIGISGYSFNRVWDLAQTPTGYVLAATTDGLFLEIDGNDNWEHINNALPAQPIRTAVHPDGDVYVGTDGSLGYPGIYVSHNNGGGWHLAFSDSTARICNSIVFNAQGHIFAGTSSYGHLSGPKVFRSIDQGKTWEVKDKGLEQLSDYATALTLAISYDGTIFAGGAGILRSTDNGENWQLINNDLPQTRIFSIVIDSSQDVVIATENGLFRSIDQGNHWGRLNDPSPNTLSRLLLVNAKGFIFAGTFGHGVFRSKDNGETWEVTNNGLQPSTGISAMATHPNQDLYIGTDVYIGIYRSQDDGETWEPINSGMDLQSVVTSIAAGSSGYIFAALGKIYRSVHSLTVGVDEKGHGARPTSFFLVQNYPNPFNSSTFIEFALPISGYVSLKVFDLSGAEIETLVSENLSAGKHKILWKAHGRRSGIYFYQIHVQNASSLSRPSFNKTSKLILLR